MENEQELKTRFAEELLKNPDKPIEAAMVLFPGPESFGLALQIINGEKNWINDPFVLSEKIRLTEEKGLRAFLPSKEKQAADIYKIAEDTRVDEEVRLKAHRLYAEVMNFIEKPQAANGGVNILSTGVMIVKDHGSNDDWEQRAIAQQRNLTSGHALQ